MNWVPVKVFIPFMINPNSTPPAEALSGLIQDISVADRIVDGVETSQNIFPEGCTYGPKLHSTISFLLRSRRLTAIIVAPFVDPLIGRTMGFSAATTSKGKNEEFPLFTTIA